MLRRIPIAVVALAGLVFPAAGAQAQAKSGSQSPAAPATGLGFVLEGGIEFGGAKLVEVTFLDGSKQSLTAGQGGTIAAGLQFVPAAQPRLSIAGTVGYKFVTNASDNANIGITRVPMEIIARWSLNPDWSIGAGLTAHASVNVNGDGFFPDAEMESSTGPTVELGWRWLAVTYTKLEYTDAADEKFDAGSVGVMVRYVWRPRAR